MKFAVRRSKECVLPDKNLVNFFLIFHWHFNAKQIELLWFFANLPFSCLPKQAIITKSRAHFVRFGYYILSKLIKNKRRLISVQIKNQIGVKVENPIIEFFYKTYECVRTQVFCKICAEKVRMCTMEGNNFWCLTLNALSLNERFEQENIL